MKRKTPQQRCTQLTDQIIEEFRLPRTTCYDFIWQRIWYALAIGVDIGTRSNKGKAVAQVDPKTDKIMKVYPTIMEAAKAIKRYNTAISNALYGKSKTCAGYKWRFTDPDNYYTYRK